MQHDDEELERREELRRRTDQHLVDLAEWRGATNERVNAHDEALRVVNTRLGEIANAINGLQIQAASLHAGLADVRNDIAGLTTTLETGRSTMIADLEATLRQHGLNRTQFLIVAIGGALATVIASVVLLALSGVKIK